MKRAASIIVLVVSTAGFLGAAEEMWTGEISDSACGAHHDSGAENVPTPPAKECVANCVRGGSTYVLVVGQKVFEIANQRAAGLEALAGSKVKVTGEAKNDAITISKIEKAD